jgi:Domain of unknown function (DUF4326)
VSYVISANVRRRHLTGAQKRELIGKLLKLDPSRSDRQIAKDVGASHVTVSSVRKQAESTGQIDQSSKRVGADGRSRPTRAKMTKPRAKPKPQKNARPLKAVPDPPADLEPSAAWSSIERELHHNLKKGHTVVVSLRSGRHKHLVAWAERADLLVRIDRQSPWGNPFTLEEDGDRGTVIQLYREHYLPFKRGLMSRVPELRGKALACWCDPMPCHGHVLRDLAEAAPTTV